MSGDKLTARFGDLVENGWASEDNPTRRGYFVREGRRTGKMNAGRYWEITDRKGKFWELMPYGDHKITVTPAPPPPAVGVTKEALARIEELAEAHRKFATAREAMNAARPAVDATQLERMLYGERYDADRAAEQAVFSLALKFAADASDILALFNGVGR